MALMLTEDAYQLLGYRTPAALRKAAMRGTFQAGVYKLGRSWRFDVALIQSQTLYDPFRPRRRRGRPLSRLRRVPGGRA